MIIPSSLTNTLNKNDTQVQFVEGRVAINVPLITLTKCKSTDQERNIGEKYEPFLGLKRCRSEYIANSSSVAQASSHRPNKQISLMND
ncbi:hypothetical protein M422DRAFT_38035 [Sphaerobolus stellatus SS14]|uniref:Uncharacterized protein n=1 Tax=Sphaerobolus stellatus (strain SS14) TaxID=990650 RepID=A0A0C9UNS3_SPHS4|nr:hypothetical protein M422DRAFT_38035 [Sphaerobolus stellatus SS14]